MENKMVMPNINFISIFNLDVKSFGDFSMYFYEIYT